MTIDRADDEGDALMDNDEATWSQVAADYMADKVDEENFVRDWSEEEFWLYYEGDG